MYYIDLIPGIWSYFWIVLIALAGIIVISMLMRKYTPSQHDIISFELTFSVDTMKKYLNDWKHDEQTGIVITNTWIDFLFIVCYSAALFSFCMIISSILYYLDTTYMSYNIATKMAYFALAAGGLDVIENIFLLYLLYSNRGEQANNVGIISVMGASIAAVSKFAFVAIIIFFIILSIITLAMIQLGIILSLLLLLVLLTFILIFVMMLKTAGGK